jgi:hypothetical protein
MPRIKLLKIGSHGQRRCECKHLLIQHRAGGFGGTWCQALHCECNRFIEREEQ